MVQNISSAVMQQRSEPSSSLDYFGTPPWATRALLERLKLSRSSVLWDPACGRGFMTRPMLDYVDNVFGSDLQDLGFGDVLDFLEPGTDCRCSDWIITNPPFKHADEFVLRALERATAGVAVLVRTAFAEGRGRYERLFKDNPPTRRCQFVDRVVMHKGDPPDPDIPIPVWDKKKNKFVNRKPSTATAYEWMVWDRRAGAVRMPAEWLDTKRQLLTREGDYDAPELAIAA